MNRLTERFRIARVMAQKIFGTLPEDENATLEAWFEASKGNEEEFNRVKKRLVLDLRQEPELDAEKEWQAFSRKLPRRNPVLRWGYVAAVLVVGVCITIGIVQVQKSRTPSGELAQSVENTVKTYKAKLLLDDGRWVNIADTSRQIIDGVEGIEVTTEGSGVKYEIKNQSDTSSRLKYNTLVVPRGGEYELTLSDGTRVWMNSGSKLVYPVRFNGKTRTVRMEGEICFQVAKNERQPFIVQTDALSVKVLGTLFNVEAYAGEPVVTTLVEGKVDVSDGKQNYILAPDQQVIVHGDKFIVRDVDAAETIRWTQGVCYFSETSLEEIMNKLARWYDVDVFFANPSAKEAHFSVEVERYDNIATVLSKIEKTGRVKFKIKDRTVIVEE